MTQPDSQAASSAPGAASDVTLPLSKRTYSIGTLRYTFGGIVILFTWLLLGDFAYNTMELVIPKVLPLTLHDVGASNATLLLIVGTIPAGMNLLLNPIISTHSDRHRGRFGRRLPYLLFATPFIAMFLIVMGFSADIGSRVHHAISGAFSNLSRTGVILVTMGVCAVVFQFFNMFVSTAYYYLMNDVIPHSMVGRFFALFRIIDAAAGFVFNRYIFGYAETESGRKWIYISMGVMYLIAFILMCSQVKEGEYPPPAPLPEGSRFERLIAVIRMYIRECYSLRFFWWLYLGNAFYRASDVMINNLGTLLAKDIGMSVGEAGKVFSWVSLAGVALYWPLGWVSDKIHATRLAVLSAAMTFAVFVASIWLVRGPTTFWIFTMLWSVAWLGYISACVPLMLHILPRDRYGQFASANAVLYAAALMIANYGGGYFVDKFGSLNFIKHGGSPYFAIYWWSAVCAGLSFVCLWLLYRGWKHYGAENYIPPVPRIPPLIASAS